MYKHGDKILLFDRVLLLRALRSHFFTSQQFVQVSLVISACLLSFGISTELRFRFSRSLCFHLDVSDIPLVQFSSFNHTVNCFAWLTAIDCVPHSEYSGLMFCLEYSLFLASKYRVCETFKVQDLLLGVGLMIFYLNSLLFFFFFPRQQSANDIQMDPWEAELLCLQDRHKPLIRMDSVIRLGQSLYFIKRGWQCSGFFLSQFFLF